MAKKKATDSLSPEKASSKKTLEELISRLEEISRLIQDGDIGLEDSIELYDEGKRIAKECSERLTAAQQKLQLIDPNLIDTNSIAPDAAPDKDDDFNDTLPNNSANGLFA
jgi:exodeoxyribonuclease VII small subunit